MIYSLYYTYYLKYDYKFYAIINNRTNKIQLIETEKENYVIEIKMTSRVHGSDASIKE